MTYGEIARRTGNPQASRAVGGANHHNPIPIVIPSTVPADPHALS